MCCCSTSKYAHAVTRVILYTGVYEFDKFSVNAGRKIDLARGGGGGVYAGGAVDDGRWGGGVENEKQWGETTRRTCGRRRRRRCFPREELKTFLNGERRARAIIVSVFIFHFLPFVFRGLKRWKKNPRRFDDSSVLYPSNHRKRDYRVDNRRDRNTEDVKRGRANRGASRMGQNPGEKKNK